VPFAAGILVPFGFLSGESHDEFNQLKWQVYDERIKQKVLSKIGVDPGEIRGQKTN